jgi:hypothetical protein
MVMPVLGNSALLKGEIIRVRLQGLDLISLDLQAQFLESLEKPNALAASGSGAFHQSPSGLDVPTPSEDDADEAMSVGPLHISVDMDSTEGNEKTADTVLD